MVVANDERRRVAVRPAERVVLNDERDDDGDDTDQREEGDRARPAPLALDDLLLGQLFFVFFCSGSGCTG